MALIILLSPSDSQLRRDLGTLRASSENLTSYMKAELQALNSKGELGSDRVLGRSGLGREDRVLIQSLVLQVTACKKGSIL